MRLDGLTAGAGWSRRGEPGSADAAPSARRAGIENEMTIGLMGVGLRIVDMRGVTRDVRARPRAAVTSMAG
jgi:hypothetical protein